MKINRYNKESCPKCGCEKFKIARKRKDSDDIIFFSCEQCNEQVVAEN